MTDLVLDAEHLTRSYGGDSLGLHDVSLAVAAGGVLAITGPSGSGKTTLLLLLAGLDRPQQGRVRLCGIDWASLAGPARARFRRQHCGVISQGLSLLPQATAAENVEIPLLLDGVRGRAARITAALDRVGLAEHARKLTDQLSGGQQQRVAIARALIGQPSLVLADEPTASLDSVTAQDVTSLLVARAKESGTAVILVTHDPQVARHADRQLPLRSGRAEEAP